MVADVVSLVGNGEGLGHDKIPQIQGAQTLNPKPETLNPRATRSGAAGVHSFGTAQGRHSESLFEGVTTTVTKHISELEYRCFEALSAKP